MVDPYFVSGLFSAFQRLLDANKHVFDLIMRSSGDFDIPDDIKVDKEYRLFIATAMTDIWLNDNFKCRSVISGLLCADEQLLESVRHLNLIKDEFRAVIMSIRGGSKSKHKFKFESSLRADPEFRDILKQYKLSNLDLEACYTHIRILPKSLNAVRWTWATKAYGVERIRILDLIQYLEINESPMREIIIERVRGMNPTDYIVEKIPKQPQLKVNVAYSDDGGNRNTSFSCSGIMLCQDLQLPKKENIFWRNIDDVKPRASRGQSIIADEPFIKFTNFYLYKPGMMPSS
jgi:hypothetical protein